MTVKSAQSWSGTFVTLDATGALATPTTGPVGTLYVDGTANGATVTISGSNPYKFAVTLPSLTAGQRVDMYITATIATIATAGIIASDQADTALLSDGVVVNSGTVTNLTNLPSIPANWITAAGVATGAIDADAIASNAITAAKIATGAITNAKFAAGAIDANAIATDAIGSAEISAAAVTKIQSGLALEATLTAIKGAGWTTETLAAIDVLIDAIKEKTDNLPANTATALTAIQNDLDNPAQYKADVSALATASALSTVSGKIDAIDDYVDSEVAAIKAKTDNLPANTATAIAAIPTNPLLASGYTAPDNAGIAAIKAKTDNLPANTSTTLAAIQADLDNPNQYKADVSGLATSAEVGAIALLGETVVGTYTVQDILKILAAKTVGKATGGGTATITYRGVDDTSDVIVETVDANGNRSAVTLTV